MFDELYCSVFSMDSDAITVDGDSAVVYGEITMCDIRQMDYDLYQWMQENDVDMDSVEDSLYYEWAERYTTQYDEQQVFMIKVDGSWYVDAKATMEW